MRLCPSVCSDEGIGYRRSDSINHQLSDNVVHGLAGHTVDPVTPKHIANAINYSFIFQRSRFRIEPSYVLVAEYIVLIMFIRSGRVLKYSRCAEV